MPSPTKYYTLSASLKTTSDMEILNRYKSLRDYVAATFSPTTQQMVDKSILFAAERMAAGYQNRGRAVCGDEKENPVYV